MRYSTVNGNDGKERSPCTAACIISYNSCLTIVTLLLLMFSCGQPYAVIAADDSRRSVGRLPDPHLTPSSDSLYYSEPEPAKQAPSIAVTRPPLEALISVEDNLDPFQLDALSASHVSLADVVDQALQNNLAIKISQADVRSNVWKLRSAYTRFLPDAKLGYQWNYLRGHLGLPFAISGGTGHIALNSPFNIAQAGVRWNVFQGGKILFTALQNRNNLRTARSNYNATTNDVLLESTRRYYNLLLSEAILQVRVRAVETSKELLHINTDLETDGKATHLDVLQARSQLADDRQNLIEQQVTRRNAAIQLAEYLNLEQSVDLLPVDGEVKLVRLIAQDVRAGNLLMAAAQHRPELKSYYQKWLAAKKGIMLAAAPLFPTVQLSATEYGLGETLDNSHRTVVTTQGALNPITLGTPAGTTPVVVHPSKQVTGLGVFAVTANWYLDAFGLTSFADIQSARSQARQAMLQSNQETNAVISQVRQSYLNQLSALRRSEESLMRVQSSAEELRLAQLRLQHGLSKNLDVLRAQQDLTSALVQHAQSTIDFNVAQVQLLHDLGLISRDNLVAVSPLKL